MIKIDKNINNVREKVDMLQMYGPKLLKECKRLEEEQSKSYPSYNFIESRSKEDERLLTTKDVMDVAYGIVQSMVAYVGSSNKFTRKQDAHLMLGKN